MCGIIGYIGNKSADIECVKLLKNLEYRGYDSAGVAAQKHNCIKVTKAEGKIANLEQLIEPSEATLGIAHTRWATHGKPTTLNAHPHVSQDGKWAVVHNGIIENFGMLKTNIENANIKLVSQTDTEVIPHLLQIQAQQNPKQDAIDVLIDACNKLKGVFALACINKDEVNTLFLAKRKSPLYIAKNKTEIFVASDPICFAGKATEYFELNDDEFCQANLNKIEFYDNTHTKIEKNTNEMQCFQNFNGKGNFSHFMLKEIYETPIVLDRIVKTYIDNNCLEKISNKLIKNINKIAIIGCGTAYHAGMMGAKYIEKLARIDCRAYVASEFRYSNPLIDNRTLCIFVSQSGETADTLAALELANSKGATTIGLTNVLYSVLAKNVDIVLPVCAGPEIAVASTKAYTAQITILYMLARHIQNMATNKKFDYISQIKHLSKNLQIPPLEIMEDVADELIKVGSAFYIGRDIDYVTAEESSLKLKEISYINSSAYPAGELKHGFLALIEEGTHLFVIATNQELLDKTLNGAHEAFARGAKVILVTQLDISSDKIDFVYKVIRLPKFEQELMPIATIPTFQLLSYLTSIKKQINPDQPRNLAKSVTVE